MTTHSPRIPSAITLVALAMLAGIDGTCCGDDSLDIAPDGATTSFVTLEAETRSSRTTGKVVQMMAKPAVGEMKPEMEASGRGYVELSGTGQYLEFPNVQNANALVIRHCVPDAPHGGGQKVTLSLYVNGIERQKLSLSSSHNWLYGKPGTNGQSNDPSAGVPHDFWDESKFFIKGGVQQGDTIKLQKDPEDTASFYRIDLIDLENVRPPLPPPPAGTYVLVKDFGAIGDGTTDNTRAFTTCISSAKEQGKAVWIPSGNYCLSDRLKLKGLAVRGAGMWYTNLIFTQIGPGWGGRTGVVLAGSGAQLRDLSIDDAADSTRSGSGGIGVTGSPTNWLVENVWLTHIILGIWMSRAQHGIIRGCRVRCTYADGINLNSGSSNNLVENCSVRGTGDDGTALLSENTTPSSSANNILRHNTVTAVWWGANCDLAGGTGHLIERNYWADNACGECFTINMPPTFPMHPLTNSIIRHNTIVRGGGNLYGQKRGAAWFLADSTTIRNVSFTANKISDSLFRGIQLAGRSHQQMKISNNVISNPGGEGVFINEEVKGSGIFTGNIVSGLTAPNSAFHNTSLGYIIIQSPAP